VSSSTERMRVLRRRRRGRMRPIKFRLAEAEIEALVSKGYLDRQHGVTPSKQANDSQTRKNSVHSGLLVSDDRLRHDEIA
jgi:hypothetical protein